MSENTNDMFYSDHELEGKIKELCDRYNYPYGSIYKYLILQIKSISYINLHIDDDSEDRLQIANLIKLLNSCCLKKNKEINSIEISGNIKISGNVINPHDGEVISEPKVIEVTNSKFLLVLLHLAHTYLEYASDGLYQRACGIENKKKSEYMSSPFVSKLDPRYRKYLGYTGDPDNENTYNDFIDTIDASYYFTEPFTEDEINEIIKYETEKEGLGERYMAKCGWKIVSMCNYLNRKNIFGGCKRGALTKEYSFLYDCFVIGKANARKFPNIGDDNSGDNRKIKYDKIKYCIKAYNKIQSIND